MARTIAVGEQDFSKIIGRSDLFENLSVWKEEQYRELQGTYPVIFLSFASAKAENYEMVRKKICQLIINLYKDHDFLVNSGFLQGEDLAYYNRISVTMDSADIENSLVQLSRYLCNYYKKRSLFYWMNMTRRCRRLI